MATQAQVDAAIEKMKAANLRLQREVSKPFSDRTRRSQHISTWNAREARIHKLYEAYDKARGYAASLKRELRGDSVSNPSSIKAQVRRLPTGEVQIKVPLRRGENPLRKAHELAKALGRKVVSVARMKNGRVCNPAELDRDAARELELFTENDANLYRQQYTPILKNLATKKARGVYDHDKAVKLFMYLMESGARKYAREYGGPGAVWHEMFNVPTRRAAAEVFAKSFEVEYGLGNYERLLPKKYQRA